MEYRHGGEHRDMTIAYDFSISINPLGMPDAAAAALKKGAEFAVTYPDYTCEDLRLALAKYHGVKPEMLVPGNGASELIMLLVNAIKPDRAIVFDPTFSGYEYALSACGCKISRAALRPLEKDGLMYFRKEVEGDSGSARRLAVLCNPNNPTGKLLKREMLAEIIAYCEANHIDLLVDECFLELSDAGIAQSVTDLCEHYSHLFIVNAFTKKYGIPGIRLGYMMSSNSEILNRVRALQPEWSVSSIAQGVGLAILEQEQTARKSPFLRKSRDFIQRERDYLKRKMEQIGCQVYPSESNFMLVRTDRRDLYEALLEHHILVRKCENFRGLDNHDIRICVHNREANNALICALSEIMGK